MGHEHHHHPGESYYLDQLCTVAVCGLLGGIAFLIWKVKLLMNFNILVPEFNLWVLLGGAALLGLVAVRAVTLWAEVGKRKAVHDHEHEHVHAHDHEHEHGESCGHDHVCEHDHEHAHEHDHEPGHVQAREHEHAHGHEHHHHAHDHGHDHGFAPWRYAVLLLPMMLSALLLYYHFNELELQYSKERLVGTMPKAKEITGGDREVADKGALTNLDFEELTRASADAGKREYFEGRTVSQKGLFAPLNNEKQFTLFKMKMTCCSADAIPLGVRIIAPEYLSNLKVKAGEGVEARGQVQFRQVVGRDEYIPVLVVKSMADIRPMKLGGSDIYVK
jgi:uncharacterized protein DUF1980